MAVAGGGPSSEISLSFSCRDLLDKDVFSKSDPIVAVYDCSAEGGKWTEVSEQDVREVTVVLGLNVGLQLISPRLCSVECL